MQNFVLAALVASVPVNGLFKQNNTVDEYDMVIRNPELEYYRYVPYDRVYPMHAFSTYEDEDPNGLGSMVKGVGSAMGKAGAAVGKAGAVAGKVGGAVGKVGAAVGSETLGAAAGSIGAVGGTLTAVGKGVTSVAKDPSQMFLDPTMMKHAAGSLAGGVGKVSALVGGLGADKIHAMLKGVADVGKIAADLAQGKPPTLDQASALLKTIPGMSDVADVVDMASKGAKAVGQAAGMLEKVTAPDDGKPKSCWVKSHGRGFGTPSMGKPCNEGRESSGGFCYNKCPTGNGIGPVCWGSCPTGTHSCGVLCMLEGTTCVEVATKITKDAIATGTKGAGQDYFGAIKGALALAGDFAYPVCATMNGLDPEFWDDEDHHRYYDQYFVQ